jgi:hypothetical protein
MQHLIMTNCEWIYEWILEKKNQAINKASEQENFALTGIVWPSPRIIFASITVKSGRVAFTETNNQFIC